MFGVDSSELFLVAIIALVFIGPKDLPKAMRTVGHWVGKIRGMARHFNSGIEAMVREAELEEMEKRWRAENERIMQEFPANGDQLMLPSQEASAEMPPSDGIPPPVDDDQPGLPLEDPDPRPPEERPLP
ncbi:Sec-independent protein translocase protein TatB [Sphingomonas alba]|uniref:Sec-independent protein translocase protein TatB n=1 Tax=Sphingomonas alba TaxID=2908208 RepID=A0ABT0RL57_9SPHN|nr:Sec-independent protein translocase protein TatB [Sphingomonas alba]MCL6683330.1 Sec-independent protein translocase protein TatB [Sphingomonas alba]